MDARLLALALGTFAIGTDSFVVAGILPDVARSLDVPVAAAGQLMTVYALAYAVMTPIMASWTAHWPRRHVLLGGLAVLSAGNILTAVLPSFELVLASRAVAGLGGAMFTPAASAAAVALVPAERRGRALAIVMAGLSGATALGAPIGTLIGSMGIGSMSDWRATMWFVTILGLVAAVGVAALLPAIPGAARLSLRERLAPIGDARVAATLLTTLLVLSGLYTVYSYISIVFDRATGGSGMVLGALISIWGVAAVAGNLIAGSLTDRFGSRKLLIVAIALAAADFALMPVTSATLAGAIGALIIWGMCGWGVLVPQQHRLVGIAPALAPILIALNAATIYIAVSVSGVLGAVALQTLDAHSLGLVGAFLILLGLIAAELAHILIRKRQADPAKIILAANRDEQSPPSTIA
ncbi:MFS transporter [Sphingomonas oleivorans]|uniref:MFS transporter n=1 Tax=Sphingomonas oleivorans TaxID=1735121 RepID=A0A2T5FZR1_9SPHN|nr:MFS transporter [Sphingomonas oleivorans]PTQ12191.1 MFS transporter [Sphingomonas oleivorans]